MKSAKRYNKFCEECSAPFVAVRIDKRFCSRDCYHHKRDRHPEDTRDTPKDAVCGLCKKPFVKIKRNQRFCSRLCYKTAWPKLNRKKASERVRLRRIAQPEWYAEREPRYAKKHRAKLLSSRPWAYLLKSRRNEAKQRAWVYDLDDVWACARWTGRCEITGIEFRINGMKGPHPFSPSLDKIEPAKGYTKENCRFILWGCNALKGVGSDEDMLEIAKAITDAHKY